MFKKLTKLPKTSFQCLPTQNITYLPLSSISIWNKIVKRPMSKRQMKKMTEDMQYNFFSIAKFIAEDHPYVVKRNSILEEIEEQEKVAFTHFSLGEYQKALEVLKSALYSAKEIQVSNDDSLIGEILKRIGDIFFEIKEYDHAINNYEESLEAMRNGLGEKDARVGRGYFILGNCYRAVENYEESINYVKKSLKVYLDVYGNKYENVIASCYTTLADDYMKMGMYKEALQNYQKLFGQLKMLYKNDPVYKNDDIYMSQYFLNYGTALAKGAGKYEEGLRYLKRFLDSQLGFNQMETMDTALCYLRIGEIKAMQGKFREAVTMCEKAVRTSIEVGGEEHKQVEMCEKALENIKNKNSGMGNSRNGNGMRLSV